MNQQVREIKVKQEDIKQVNHPDHRHAYFANYFAIEVANDDITFGFGQKIPGENGNDLPVHEIKERIILTKNGAKVFYDLLESVFKKEVANK